MMRKLVQALSGAALLLVAAGCNGNKIDCAQVCAAYEDCVDSDTEVLECTRSCEDRADESDEHEEMLEACENCIEGRACAESARNCAADCAGVISPD